MHTERNLVVLRDGLWLVADEIQNLLAQNWDDEALRELVRLRGLLMDVLSMCRRLEERTQCGPRANYK